MHEISEPEELKTFFRALAYVCTVIDVIVIALIVVYIMCGGDMAWPLG